MADSPETRVLKDINRHLANIEGQGKTPPGDDRAAIGAMTELLGNFESLMDAKLKRVTLETDKAFNQAFGNLQGFNEKAADEQISALDDVIDQLEMSNKFLKSSDDLEFLKEAERAEDLKINRRTNDLLEDILEKEPDIDQMGGMGGAGGLGGLAGLGMAGLGAAQLKRLFSRGGLIALGKTVGGGILGGLFLKSFFDGFAEGMEDSTKPFSARLMSGIGQVLEDFSFGFLTKEQIEKLGAKFRARMIVAGNDIQKAWDEYWAGGKPLSDAMAETLSGLSLGTLSPEVIKELGKNAKFFAEETGETFWRSVFSAMGFKVKPRLTPEQRKAAEENKQIEAEFRKQFKEKQKIVPALERLFEEAKVPLERRAQVRELLGGKLAMLTTGEKKQMAAEQFFVDEEDAEKFAAARARDRVAFIENQMQMLQNKIERQQFLEDRRKKKEKDAIKAAEDKLASEKMAAENIKKAIEEDKAMREALKRLAEDGQQSGPIIQQNNSISSNQDTGTGTDDPYYQRVPDASGLFPPRR
jgi:hypothetical protein